jgi:riboflavin biosynthesis pyrimidine reductase
MSAPARPRVICHMMPSVDGRIVTAGWPSFAEGRHEYERIHASLGGDAWMCGRITMEPFAGAVRTPGEVARQAPLGTERPDFIAPGAAPTYAIAIDPAGRLAWKAGEIDGDHVVAVLTQQVSDEYLDFLRSRGVSYLFAGARDVDLAVALDRIAGALGVRTLLLEGGGRINGMMLRDGLIDEVSLLVAPIADGTIGAPALFDVDAGPDHAARRLSLQSVERRADDLLWLRYHVT